ncbi:MAG: DUF1349 domain-containing protein [Roseitalea sp.]|jgi:regulation of enolase protein 1 (concanavalin A-like superfamily)|nr:DUF1349 domain-containing protein [Roseitalea sp.]MBO6722673.1 DUF1349 domain-containing protein [Roseitalea sp.]MBO6741543.1 DUF1349 domain-containing protein [Roseitalea sp.]
MGATLPFLRDAQWFGEPPTWDWTAGGLEVVTGDRTDFWQETFYGFHRDDGHFLGAPAPREFSATVTFEGDYETLYDQAGMMLRLNERTWLKTGIEFSDDVTNFSVVVTRERSDWSVIGVPLVSGPQQVRLTRLGNAVLVHFRNQAGNWNLMRVADFPNTDGAWIGPMACSPQRAGFRARFSDFAIDKPIENALHSN